jgi:NAD(P)-dependent dehydrogenase (short-subunit alcohol dehydrogenase family)
VVVTGASRGIGAAIAQRLAGDGYGVVVNYAADADGAESVVSAIKAKGGRATAVRADVASEDDVAAMIDRAQEQMGPLTALVNNAGITGEHARIDEQHADELTRLMQVNIVGSMVCAKHAVRAMSTARGGQGGSIVTIASIAAKAPGGAQVAVPYGATKGALVTFARGLSNEVAAEGIRSNSVSPGVIDTEMASSPELRAWQAHGPLGRIGRPDEIAAAVSWLISPEASYVTGSDITVSGGLLSTKCVLHPHAVGGRPGNFVRHQNLGRIGKSRGAPLGQAADGPRAWSWAFNEAEKQEVGVNGEPAVFFGFALGEFWKRLGLG